MSEQTTAETEGAAPAKAEGPPRLPATGVLWEDLRADIKNLPVDKFLDNAQEHPFLIELPQGITLPLLSEEDIIPRLIALRESPDLEDCRVFFLVPRTAGAPIKVGRDHDCDVLIDDPSASTHHADLHHVDQGWAVTDNQSTNKTYYEGIVLEEGMTQLFQRTGVVEFSKYRAMFIHPADLHALAQMEVPPPKAKGPDPWDLTTSPVGRWLRGLVSTLQDVSKDEFVAKCRACFLLQVPLEEDPEPDIPGEKLTKEAPRDQTTKISRTRLLKLRRNKRARRARIHTIYPSAEGTTIGRETDCPVALLDDTVSLKHARIVKTDEGWQLLDLGSENGTLVEGEEVPDGITFQLQSGQKIDFASYRALFLLPHQLYDMGVLVQKGTKKLDWKKASEAIGWELPAEEKKSQDEKEEETREAVWPPSKPLDLTKQRPSQRLKAPTETQRVSVGQSLRNLKKNKKALKTIFFFLVASALIPFAVMKVMEVMRAFTE